MPMNPRLLRPLAGRSLLLDRYPDARVAYSLRRLSSAYSGPVVKVRRSSDSAEEDFTATEVSGGSLATWVGAGNDGFVRTWYDQSGNGTNANQTTSNRQPKIVSSGSLVLTPEGRPAMELTTTGFAVGANVYSGSYSFFSVIQPDLTPAVSSFDLFQAMAATGNGSFFRFDRNNTRLVWFLASNLTTGFGYITQSLNPNAVYSGTADIVSGAVALYRNGAQGASGTLASWSDRTADLSLFAYDAGASATFQGKASEIIFYTSAVAARADVEAEMQKHYGIT